MTLPDAKDRRSRRRPVSAAVLTYTAGLTALLSVLGIGLIAAMAKIDYLRPHSGDGPDPRPQWDVSELVWAIAPAVALLLALVALTVGLLSKARSSGVQHQAPHPSPAEVAPRRSAVDWAMILCTVAMVINGVTIVAVSLFPG